MGSFVKPVSSAKNHNPASDDVLWGGASQGGLVVSCSLRDSPLETKALQDVEAGLAFQGSKRWGHREVQPASPLAQPTSLLQ